MSDFIDLLTAPFIFPFMQKAIITAIVTGAVCAILSCFLVLKGWSLMGMPSPMLYYRGLLLLLLRVYHLLLGHLFRACFVHLPPDTSKRIVVSKKIL